MGLPELSIYFKEVIRKAVPAVSVGNVLIVTNSTKVTDKGLITLDENTKFADDSAEVKALKNALVGNVQDVRVTANTLEEREYKPSKVSLYVLSQDEQLADALNKLKEEDIDFIGYLNATDEIDDDANTKIVNFVANRKADTNKSAFAVIASTSTTNNDENVIVIDGEAVLGEGSNTLSANYSIPLLCSILAGTPLEQSVTYARAGKYTTVTPVKTKTERNAIIDAGKLTYTTLNGNAVIASGVTSYHDSTTAKKGDTFKKIKPVRIYKYINNVLVDTINRYYVGKVANSYNNKLILIVEIKQFLKELSKRELIDTDYTVDVDVEENKKYLINKGVDVSQMSVEDVKTANTGNKVYLAIKIKAIDSMEDISISVEV